MAALVEGHNYELASQESTSAEKSLVHVKLTDSALKAFEEFQKIQVGMESGKCVFAAKTGQHMGEVGSQNLPA